MFEHEEREVEEEEEGWIVHLFHPLRNLCFLFCGQEKCVELSKQREREPRDGSGHRPHMGNN
jgi:hypothetical protein